MKTEARFDRDALDAMYEASNQVPCIAEKLKGVSLEQFKASLSGHAILGFYRGEKCIGGCIYKDSQGHISILDGYKRLWCNKETMKAFWELWTRDGPNVFTWADMRNHEGINFLEKLGLKPTERKGLLVKYEGYHV